MLDDRGAEFRYRDYREEPLSEAEIRRTLSLLEVTPRDALRRRDRAYRELALSGDEPDEVLVELMARHPTLLQRPIGVLGDRAVLGRPPEKLLELVASAD